MTIFLICLGGVPSHYIIYALFRSGGVTFQVWGKIFEWGSSTHIGRIHYIGPTRERKKNGKMKGTMPCVML